LARPDGIVRQQATTPDLFDLTDKVAFIAGFVTGQVLCVDGGTGASQ